MSAAAAAGVKPALDIRDARPGEFDAPGCLLVDVYRGFEGFPTPAEQPRYDEMLADTGRFAETPRARVLVAAHAGGVLVGGVVHFGDMAHYGSGGSATSVRDASGIRLLGVDPRHRGLGVGKALMLACIALARAPNVTPR